MGRHERQQEMWAEPVNLGKLIPEDAPLRKIQRVLKLDFVREEVTRFYGHNGNESVDPVIIVKLMLLLFLDDVPSERELLRVTAMRIDYRWFLGYDLTDAVPRSQRAIQGAEQVGRGGFSGALRTGGEAVRGGGSGGCEQDPPRQQPG